MSASSQAIQKSVQRLRGQMIRTARGFRDYNFRQYFVQHIKDDFDAVAKLSPEEKKKFLVTEGHEKLRQMQRMVVVNQMYAKRPVYFDAAVHHHPSRHHQQHHSSSTEHKIE
ncbi:putative mitochondrial iron-sulfur cluster assembly protein [Leptomonas pyrrhocoris]|uniref:Putative mitochondrial iron-sulfur cluster assembly protein n=1 Tax=Leptomonas pyrrhocoris TaxID=157538 RepID=A0A0N0VDU5_LEPPY|nr:putative mitochondrial iron-sulfur cluster assembly protein [Leptomonas pyrrhocoris]XP_015655034.1 putative mitochondrial iron-sulfur cluster assembly protein [Leptomonas pyrrhocoris]KPA76594.1 putative mitochondrial iron-sulfur cluster assembly protein [Leptomonas pyrrhocoris]KPA76595.1 putative mitochondrial iron-sulfur cluster assembly protein [Leptomonas pyrrhocoris]|eukprot:XP_015655033.1 putative mitochondrial iron-sulfur cluster assembly protein [Leptomonas pyrrhocoris]